MPTSPKIENTRLATAAPMEARKKLLGFRVWVRWGLRVLGCHKARRNKGLGFDGRGSLEGGPIREGGRPAKVEARGRRGT
jgi:hypothetical protein